MFNIDKLKNYIQSANINFLFGSGLSRPYLITLGDIEKWLTEVIMIDDADLRNIIQASIYKKYFEGVILPNTEDSIEDDILYYSKYPYVLNNYSTFLSIWNEIIVRRNSNLLNKQINIYTTNIDLFVERAAEKTRIEFNDGFKGVMNPLFDEGNFHKSYSKTSAYFQHTSEIPVFNLLKLHGSINWVALKEQDNRITCDVALSNVVKAHNALNEIGSDLFIPIEVDDTIESLKAKAQGILDNQEDFNFGVFESFFEFYQDIVMVNPTKHKFKETVLDLHFYELMRLYSNSLEKENSILFVQGFSFADEHISKITQRAAETNPTLLIIIFSYDDDEKMNFEKKLDLVHGGPKNNNIWVVTPSSFVDANSYNLNEEERGVFINKYKAFDFKTINEIYRSVANLIPFK